MTKRKWAVITGILITAYGALLLLEALWPGWAMVQGTVGLNVAKTVGGLLLLGWGIAFFRLRS